jgi:hypothetical protein
MPPITSSVPTASTTDRRERDALMRCVVYGYRIWCGNPERCEGHTRVRAIAPEVRVGATSLVVRIP